MTISDQFSKHEHKQQQVLKEIKQTREKNSSGQQEANQVTHLIHFS